MCPAEWSLHNSDFEKIPIEIKMHTAKKMILIKF